ncbi:MAG: hypothetical protein WCB85_14680 [Candidatus Dormiibacterota bacterium]
MSIGSRDALAPPDRLPGSRIGSIVRVQSQARNSIWWVVVLSAAIVLAVHVVLGAFLVVACGDLHCNAAGVNWYGAPPATSGWQGLLVGPWLRDDAVYYAQVASHGYVSAGPGIGPLGIFFPLFPLLTRALMPLAGGDAVLAGLAVNALLTVAALTLLYGLIADDHGSTAGRVGLVLLAASPAVFFMLAPLSEAAFLTFTLATVLAARRGRIGLAGLLAVGATLSRDQGILVLVPLVFAVFERARARRGAGRLPLSWSDASLALAPLSFLGFQLYLPGHGYAGGTFAAELVYMHTHPAAPWVPLWESLRLVVSHADAAELVNLVAVVLLAASIPLMWRRLRPGDTAYAVVSLLVIISHVGGFSPLESALRFTVTVYPVWLLLGASVRTPRAVGRVLVILAASTVMVAVGVTGFHMVQ